MGRKFALLGLILGALAGYAYYYFIGRSTGTCAITGKPWSATLYGATVGYLIFSVMDTQPKSRRRQTMANGQ